MLLAWSVERCRRRGPRLRSSAAVLRALILFLLAVSVSTLFSLEFSLSIFGTYERQLGLTGLVATTFFCLLLAEAITSEARICTLIKTMALAGSLCGLYGLLQYCRLDPFGWSEAFGNRPISTLGHPDFFGVLLAMTLPLAVSLCYRTGTRSERLFWFLAVGIQLCGLLVSQTRGAWIAASVSLVGFLMAEPWLYRVRGKLLRKKVSTSSLALGVLLCLWLSASLLMPELRERAASIFHWKEQTRIYLWLDTLKVIRDYPLSGSGPETFRVAFMPHKSIELAGLERNVNFDNPHNNYLYLWATTGSVGLFAYLYLLFACVQEGMRRTRLPDGSCATLYLGVVSSLVAYGVCMLTGFDTLATLGYFYILVAILAAGTSRPEREACGGTGNTFRQYAVMLATAVLLGVAVYDASRAWRADQLVQKALILDERDPAASEKAEALLEGACAMLPRESFYRLRLAESYLKNAQEAKHKERRLRRALHWGELSLQQGWAPENSYQLIGTAYLRLGACNEAELNARRGLAIDPYNFPLRITLARALTCQGRNEEALQEAERAFSVDPSYAPARRLEKKLRAQGTERREIKSK